MAMIHKFREEDLTETFPELNASPNILVMTDEAHRSQYKQLGANLDKGIPNAAKIGYTGTPIDKTEQVFGDYIDKYTMRQSIEDGVTLEIVYEGRTHNAEVPDQGVMDAAFQDVFSEYRHPAASGHPRVRIARRLSRSRAHHRGQGQGHGGALPRACVPQRLQSTGGGDVTRGCRALQEASGRCSRGGGRKAGAYRHGQAAPGAPQGD